MNNPRCGGEVGRGRVWSDSLPGASNLPFLLGGDTDDWIRALFTQGHSGPSQVA